MEVFFIFMWSGKIFLKILCVHLNLIKQVWIRLDLLSIDYYGQLEIIVDIFD
jgi:hypothetical protein